MKKKFFNLYIIDSIITFLILVLFFILSYTVKNDVFFNFAKLFNYYYVSIILIIISISLFIVVLRLKNKKYDLDVNNMKLPILYLIFVSLILLVSFILNFYVVIINMHFVYFYRFILIGYILLSTYVITSFKK
jgi:hypothetical protein